MNVTEVRIRLVNNDEGKLRAMASITIDECFVVHDLRVVEGTDSLFVAMPCKKTHDGGHWDLVHPLNNPTREHIKTKVLEAYDKAKRAATEK